MLLSQSFLVSPSDSTGLTGQVGHTIRLSGFQNGKKVLITIVAVLNIKLEEKMRKVETESFILESDFQPLAKEVVMGIKALISSTFHAILVQDREDVFDIVYEANFSKDVVEK